MPIITLIVPFYKAENFIFRLTQNIEQALGSIDQNKVQIIFVDDWGLDNSRQLLEKIDNFKFEIVDCGKNQGLGGARNLGVQYSKGQWIMFMDHDDLLKENSFEQIIELIEDNDQINLVRFNYIEKRLDNEHYYKFKRTSSQIQSLFPVMTWSKIIRKELYIPSRDHIYYEDSLWTFDFIKSKKHDLIKYGFIDEYIYIYDRTNENSITSKIHFHDFEIVVKTLLELLDDVEGEARLNLILLYLFYIKYTVSEVKSLRILKLLLKYVPSIRFKDYLNALNYKRKQQL